jgi:hypothetical protein
MRRSNRALKSKAIEIDLNPENLGEQKVECWSAEKKE